MVQFLVIEDRSIKIGKPGVNSHQGFIVLDTATHEDVCFTSHKDKAEQVARALNNVSVDDSGYSQHSGC